MSDIVRAMEPPITSDSSQSNKVLVRDDYIEVTVVGPQNSDTIHRINLDAEAVVNLFKSKGKPILVLVHMADLQARPDLGAFKEALKIFRMVKVDRAAMYGDLPPMMMSLIDTIISSLSPEFELKYLASRDEAMSWLKEYRP